jgi:DNA-binding CsgD family transcriptional regulator/PAS domain-containing protein
MDETEALSALIGDIYDAALDPTLWPRVVEKAGGFVGGSAASLFARDSVYKTGNSYYAFGVDPHYEKLYFEKYIKFDPLNAVYLTLAVGDVISNSNIIPHAEFVETRFYKEWAQPQGWTDNVIASLEKSSTSIAGFVVFRHEREGLADDATRRLMRLIAPHLRRAVLIGKVVDLNKVEAATFAETLDGLGAGIFLVDVSGRIVHANAAGHMMLNSASVLHTAGGRLILHDPHADRTLADTFAAAGNGDAAIGVKGVAVPLVGRDGERHVAHVLPLTSGARRRAGASYAAVAALFVHKAALDTPSPPEVIAKAYKLTPMESRVMLAIVEVGGVPEVAEALGIAETTVKTHLGRIYKKTDSDRQADLVKLVAGFSNPLRD